MVKSFNCCICDELVTPGQHHSGCKHTCGKPECQKVYIKQLSKKFDYKRQRERIEKLKANGIDLVTCQICGEEFEMIHHGHLKLHGITVAEYKNRYPKAKTMNSRARESRGRGSTSQSYYLSYGGKQPDSELFEFMTGSLLGDGSLEKQKFKKNARYAEGGSNQAYLSWKHSFLSQYFHCTFSERLSKADSRTGKQYHGWWLKTSVHPVLTKIHAEWYQSRKIVPTQFIEKHLTKFALSIWFCDDGCSSGGINLYTMGFEYSEVNFLKELLKKRFNLRFSLLTNKEQQPFLKLRAESKSQFRSILSEFSFPGMSYKLEF